jgi:hypothetical protein
MQLCHGGQRLIIEQHECQSNNILYRNVSSPVNGSPDTLSDRFSSKLLRRGWRKAALTALLTDPMGCQFLGLQTVAVNETVAVREVIKTAV